MQEIIVSNTDAGRLDGFAEKFSLSRSRLKSLIRQGVVYVNGVIVKKPGFIVHDKDRIRVSASLESGAQSGGDDLARGKLSTVYEDQYMLVIDKRPGVRVEDLIPSSDRNKYFLAHRLDKDTSGLLVIAKSAAILPNLQRQWKDRAVKKTYRALVQGHLTPRRGRIEAPIFRSMRDRKKMAVSKAKRARSAYTEYKVLRYYKDNTLLEAYPLTGRTHQIRVHFASIGHSVCGDKTYSKHTDSDVFPRQFLHAYALRLAHPRTGKKLSLISELPKDLKDALSTIEICVRRS